MRFCTHRYLSINTFKLLGVYAMYMTGIGIKINLLVEVESAFWLDTRLKRKVGGC